MSVRQVITIRNTHDITNSRMQVREAARRAGMDLSDQARISLATSSLIEGLGMGNEPGSSSVSIEQVNNEQEKGLRVVFAFAKPRYHQVVHTAAGNVGWMVDDVSINYISDEQVEIILTKWVAGRKS
jgi:hypothetical protein